MIIKTIGILIFIQIGIGICLFIREKRDVVFLENLTIQSRNADLYPDNFQINLNEFNKNLRADFVKVNNYGLPAVSYFSNGQVRD